MISSSQMVSAGLMGKVMLFHLLSSKNYTRQVPLRRRETRVRTSLSASLSHVSACITFIIMDMVGMSILLKKFFFFGFSSNSFSQSTLVNEIFSGLLRDLGEGNGLHVKHLENLIQLTMEGRINLSKDEQVLSFCFVLFLIKKKPLCWAMSHPFQGDDRISVHKAF